MKEKLSDGVCFRREKERGFSMKRRMARIGTLLLAALVLLAALPLGALAQEESVMEGAQPIQWGDGETGVILLETQDTLGGGELGFSGQTEFSAALGSYDDGSLYGQLGSRAKKCYDALSSLSLDSILSAGETDGYRQMELEVEGVSGTTLTGNVRGDTFWPDSASQGAYRALFTDLCAAITALRYDDADALWLSDMRYGVFWRRGTGSTVTISKVVFAFRLEYSGQEGQMWNEMMASARSIAAQADAQPDRYSKVKTIHDLLAERSTYNYASLEEPNTIEASLSHQAYSALVAGDIYEPVCDGYAKAVKVVCDLLEIPCVLVSSSTHMWNNIKMDDGEWYNLDLTWDDGDDENLSYNYFLIGSQTKVGGQAFSTEPSHLEENPWQPVSNLNYVTFTYPTKNQQKYEYLGMDYTPLRFPDVKRSAWYYDYVEEAAGMGLFSGDEQGLFRPGNDITRAQFVQVLYNAVKPDYTLETSQFSDVPVDAWYASAVNWAAELGVVSGKGQGRFAPNAPITREEMCVVLMNYRTHVQNLSGELQSHQFADDSSISNWAKDSVYEAYAIGLISGREANSFEPQGNTLRSEAAVVYVKFVQMQEGDQAESQAA